MNDLHVVKTEKIEDKNTLPFKRTCLKKYLYKYKGNIRVIIVEIKLLWEAHSTKLSDFDMIQQ